MFTLPTIRPTANPSLQAALQQTIDNKTKPRGSLGRLEALALQMGLIQRQGSISLQAPQVVVFAADHGLAAEKISAYPPDVTPQMVNNMLAGGAAISVLARQHGFALTVVDAGVATDLPEHPQLLKRKIAYGTRNARLTLAMSAQQAEAALIAGMEVVQSLPGNVLALGEMGIGNSSSASLMFARLADVKLEDAIGRGTGISDEQLQRKRQVLLRAHLRHQQAKGPMEILSAFGGFEIAMMTGAMLQAASERRVVIVDGFIAGAAALLARALSPQVMDYLIFSHVGAEQGHGLMLSRLNVRALLKLEMRLGEGSGALMAWPLLQFAVNFLNEMASFESAGVSEKVN
jgi:nicotinate-nucleotide--dimethylbenzimidazole phosphoribosyltransferase